ncbi:DNA-directed RNA polymerase subunit beta [Candidatus Gracilibacteria bacterium]|nr:DNA-directed RNA polymerase subunit beta [Candidatus Gracilibacteria bacterium]MCF7819719.1 DNA-directed RNA polymerase subunit beta [Candidatus Gracilibacteria bacterium]
MAKKTLQFPAKLTPTKEEEGRYFFSDVEKDFPFPDLIAVQTQSYNWFLEKGIKELLDEINPIEDATGKKLRLEIQSYEIEEPKYGIETCREKGLSYESIIRAHVALTNLESGEIKEQDVYFGQIPRITSDGTFLVNGIERIIVSQIVRSPGIFFATNNSLPGTYSAKMIPKRGAWLELETDKRGLVWVKVDRKRKIPVTMFLRAFGYSTDKEIIDLFAKETKDLDENPILKTLDKDESSEEKEAWQGVYKRIRPGDLATPENARNFIEEMFHNYRKYDLGPIARYKIDKRFGLKPVSKEKGRIFRIEDFIAMVKELIVLNAGKGIGADDIDHLSNRRIRAVGELVQNKFRVGLLRTERIVRDRMSIVDLESVTPTQIVNCRPITASMHEFFASSQLSQFMDQTNPLAELEHKRRISAMGPGGLSRERASFEVRDVHPSHYGRICPVTTPEGPNIGLVLHLASYASVNEYGFIETPYRKVSHTAKNDGESVVGRTINQVIKDGKKIVAKKETVADKKLAAELKKIKSLKEIPVRAYVTDEVEYYDAEAEKDMSIAQANTLLNEKGEFAKDLVSARKNYEPGSYHESNITHIDVSPKQIVSLSTALISFLEHDDNTRALMGSNMQRQAVPLINPDSPVIGTGMEKITSQDQCVRAPESGEIKYVDANEVVFVGKSGKKITFPVVHFRRTNQSTCITQKPQVEAGDKVKKGEVLIDGASVQNGELALGQNLLVAYMSWSGFNYEDAVIVSDRVVKEGLFDSIHIEKYEMDVRDTKLGPEELTADIPNVAASKLKDLDENGLVRIGATVLAGDILAGKVTPKGETELTAEDRLLRAIFGEKAHDVKDSSLRLPRGSGGKVIEVSVLNRSEGDDLPTGVIKRIQVKVAQLRHLEAGDKMAGRHGNKGVISRIVPSEDMPHMEDGTPVDIILNPLGVSSRMNIGQILETHLGIAASKMGIKIATPVLSGINVDQIQAFLKENDFPEDGKFQLYDGRSGEAFDHKTVVGVVYMLKLIHLVEDKMHARSVGPYSLVTQQPFGGKAQNGGQRFGEMEVWALEAYGAAHTLQEMLTIKSDDVHGRAKAYEAIVHGDPIELVSIPESFNVLIKELQALCLKVELLKDGQVLEGGEVDTDDDEAGTEEKDHELIDESSDVQQVTDEGEIMHQDPGMSLKESDETEDSEEENASDEGEEEKS